MQSIQQMVAFVKEQIEFHEKRVAKYATEPKRQKYHAITAERFRFLGELLSNIDSQRLAEAKARPVVTESVRLILQPEDVEGLPLELVKELSISPTDHTEFAIVGLINEAGGIMTLDQILIGLYKRTGEIHKRPNVTSRLYRMVQKGLLFNVTGRKGVYSTRPLSEQEVEQLK